MNTLVQDSFTATERCDRCGAQAYVRVKLGSGELLFCGHHAKEYDHALRRVAIEIQDETARISGES